MFVESRVFPQAKNEMKSESQGRVIARMIAQIIALMADPTPDFLAGVLGILKSGNGFVPIDPAHPVDRIGFVIADCRAEVLITEAKYLDKALKVAEASPRLKHVICLDELEDKNDKSAGLNASLRDWSDYRDKDAAPAAVVPASIEAASQTAYVIYTSGSTGRPKGVPITFGNLMPLLHWSKDYFGFSEQTSVLQNLSQSFDFGAFEILTTVLFGGELHFLDKSEITHTSRYAEYITEHSINTIHSTPMFFKEVISAGGRLDTLKLVHLGGEQLTGSAVDQIFESLPADCTVYNGYGPTEATINCCIFEVGSPASRNDSGLINIPIGRASANNFVYVLDADNRPAPVGASGELCVGGLALTAGYINNPDLTAEKLIPNPLSDNPGSRLYRTGDLVRYGPEGNIEFLRRIDEQVKIRGFRIELGEIESVIAHHPAVRQSHVIIREDAPGDKRITAYVVSRAGAELEAGELRSFLRERLPAYMIPSAFINLEAIPLTPNGKIDRRALPAPGVELVAPGTYSPPSNQIEELLANLWASTLGVARVGRNDSFFELGGHSLLATKMMSRARDMFQVELPLRTLFEDPFLASMADAIEKAMKIAPGSESAPIARVSREGDIPLSFAQQRLWITHQMHPTTRANIMADMTRFSGALDVIALSYAIDEVVKRHESLRTTFPAIDGVPVQLISPPQPVNFPMADLSELSETDCEDEIERLGIESAELPFDVVIGPLFRVRVVRLREDDHIVFHAMHHIITDGWSQDVLFREVAAFYQSRITGRPAPLPELPIQYADFAVWQRNWFQGEILQRQLAYWKTQLANAPRGINLPTDRPIRPAQEFSGAKEHLALSRDVAEGALAFSRSHGVTMFMTMLAAFNALLTRYTGQEDVLVRFVIANRNRQEIENLIGFFVNTLVMRTNLSGDPSFAELLGRVRETALGAFANQDLPFEKLIEELHVEREMARPPLANVMIAYQNLPRTVKEFPGVKSGTMGIDRGSPKFDLSFFMGDSSEGLWWLMHYNSLLFDAGTITLLLGHIRTLLEGAIANPNAPLSSLPLLSEPEILTLTTWNKTAASYEKDACVHKAFEAEAAQIPDALAVVCEDEQLSYGELNRRANQLANYLRRLGAGPEQLIAICIDRSVDMLIALIGILKSGAAYVPIDPSYPAERRSLIISDSKASIVLSRRRTADAITECERVVCLDSDWSAISAENEDNPLTNVTSDNAAYVIYTSGSTGKPKGVLIQHRSVFNLLAGLDDAVYQDSERRSQRVSVNGPIAFDTSVKQLIQLLRGHTLNVIPREVRLDENAMLAYIRRAGISVLDCTPSHLGMLLAGGLLETSSGSLQKVLIGGEAIDGPTWEILARNDQVEFYNVYGPTECTVNAAICRVRPELDRPTIGEPIANVQTHVLDPLHRLLPFHIPGELSIGGEGLARGYLNHPELTAEKFIPDAFSGERGARMYRTGDLARYLPEGNIEFLGRVDNQVKLRGFRIELGEIESALNKHPGVRGSVVIARDDMPGGKALAAYVVREPAKFTEEESKQLYFLPNRMAVNHLNRNETEFLYKEVFEVQAYLKNGITIYDGDCIVDVGANIGLFTLFANQMAANTRIFAFEPNPYVFEKLQRNVSLYDVNAKLFPKGLFSNGGSASFTFYTKFSFLSGLYADVDDDKRVVRSFIREQQRTEETLSLDDKGEALLEELLDDRFNSSELNVELTTLSDFIRENNIPRIDLLKINVEKSEMDVLAGIRDQDWPKIRQLVFELYDMEGRLDQAKALLDRLGYTYVVEQDWSLEENAKMNYYIYAVREYRPAGGMRPRALELPAVQTPLSAPDLRDFLKERLPDYMMPAAYVLLDELPLTSHGKVDRAALPMPSPTQLASESENSAPRTPTQELLAGIWSSVLGRDQIGIHDNFFDLGGHSLLATRVVSRAREVFELEIGLLELFEAPTIAGFGERVDRLAASGRGLEAPSIRPAPRVGELPLSYAQQRLWIVNQIDPDSPAYNIANADRFIGSLDLGALLRAFNEIVARHESLRTTFPAVDGLPVQRIAPKRELELPLVDLELVPEDERVREARRLASVDALRPFDLATGPLFRATVLRLSDQDHVVMNTLHHIISDGWSGEVLDREVGLLYEAFSNGKPSPLPDLPVQYADFAVWQRGWLKGEVLEAQLSYWKRRMTGAPPVLSLPADYPRPEIQSLRGARMFMTTSREISAALREVSRRKGVTLFMTMLAVFKVLVYFRTGRLDLVIGSNVANRNRGETEGLIGFFVNLLPLRTDLSGDPTFEQLLDRVRTTALDAYAHQDVPFESISKTLKVERSPGHTPVVQVVFAFNSLTISAPGLPGLTISALSTQLETSRFDLALGVAEDGDGFRATMNYNPDLFKPETIERMLLDYEKLLTYFTEHPEATIESAKTHAGVEAVSRNVKREDLREAKLKRLKVARRRTVNGSNGATEADHKAPGPVAAALQTPDVDLESSTW